MKEMLLYSVLAIVGVFIGQALAQAVSPVVRLKQYDWTCTARDFFGCIKWERTK